MKLDRRHRAAATVAWLALCSLLSSCRGPAPGTDLVPALDPQKPEIGALKAATVARRDRDWVLKQTGKIIRIHDVVHRTVPASPPGRLEYDVDIPKDAHFTAALGIAEDHYDRPPIEFVVKVRHGDREEALATQLVDPLNKPAQRRWLPFDVDLSKHAGRATLVLETRGYESDKEDLRWAFWGSPAITSPKRKTPLVIVYLVDTLRADHTTPYGYTRDTTPELKKFAEDSVLFETAITAASWTKPAVGSVFTSQLPGHHRAIQLRDPLSEGNFTLAEAFKQKGFVTGAAIGNSVIYADGTQFEQGFDFYAGLHGADDRTTKTVEAGPVVDTALAWLDARRGIPAFLYVHTMDPHVPYTPPAPFDMKFEPHPAPYGATDPREDYREPLDRDRMIAQYDGEIAYGDQEFGRFIRELKARGLYEDALIVFLADHGEEFLDHGEWTHGKTVFDELIHVPLIAKFPGRKDAGRRIAQQVQTMDIYPTALEAMGLPIPPREVVSGHPMQPVIRGTAGEPAAVSEISHRGYVAYGMRTRQDKYVRRFSPEENEWYFDLGKDPKEQKDRLAEAPDRSRKLKADVEQAMAKSPYRHNLKFVGGGTYSLKLRCAGWIDGFEPIAFGGGERADLDRATQTLTVEVHPKVGQPRELFLSVRPMGAPIWVSGTRDGRPLAAGDVFMAEESVHPASVPFKLPEVESESERADNMLEAPKTQSYGLHVWVTLLPGQSIRNISKEECEKLKALGYVSGPCQ
jgi:arylsulfatase A-like enzyme